MRRARAIVCSLWSVALLLAGASLPALAQNAAPDAPQASAQESDHAHPVGDAFFDGNIKEEGRDAFLLVTDDGPPKFAGILAKVYSDSSKPPDQLVMVFDNKTEWAKFAVLWDTAFHAPLPSKDDDYKIDKDEGSYFDSSSQVDVTVSKESDGDIVFAFAGNPDSNNSPTALGLITVLAENFNDFEQDVETVSAFLDAQ